MKKLFCSAIFLLLFLNLMYAQEQFEGSIQYRITNDSLTTFIEYYSGVHNFRIDLKTEPESSIISSDGKYFMLMPAQKVYMELTSQMVNELNSVLHEEQGSVKTGLEKFRTGVKKNILGYECEKIFYEDKSGSVEIWATEQLGKFNFMENFADDNGSAVFNNLKNTNLFPLSFSARDKDSDKVMSFEILKINKFSPDVSMFLIPKDYQKISVNPEE